MPTGTLLVAMSPAHYFDDRPAVASRRREVDLAVPGETLRLASDRGVFSSDRLDPGTRHLLDVALHDPAVPRPPAGDLLDLGCGWGPIALCLARCLARSDPATRVWALDVNQRALALVAENAGRLGLDNVRPVTADQVPAGLVFAGIWSNPPVRIGKAALHQLLGTWLPRLAPSGSAWLVVHRHLGADSLASWLGDAGWAVRRAASKSGYRVLDVRRRQGDRSEDGPGVDGRSGDGPRQGNRSEDGPRQGDRSEDGRPDPGAIPGAW
ncbi:MAG: class I SAM-dependent methyltransferase [Acidimicrobiales bacterium]